MRIIGGAFKGMRIASPTKKQTRPTTDRAREMIFNILEHRFCDYPIDNAKVLDLFCGSGALGLECLSRGARDVLFIDWDREALQGCQETLKKCHAQSLGRIMRQDVTRLKDAPYSFDLIFMDPPYHHGMVQQVMPSLFERGWVTSKSLFIIETAHDEELKENIQALSLELLLERVCGAAKVFFMRQYL